MYIFCNSIISVLPSFFSLSPVRKKHKVKIRGEPPSLQTLWKSLKTLISQKIFSHQFILQLWLLGDQDSDTIQIGKFLFLNLKNLKVRNIKKSSIEVLSFKYYSCLFSKQVALKSDSVSVWVFWVYREVLRYLHTSGYHQYFIKDFQVAFLWCEHGFNDKPKQ